MRQRLTNLRPNGIANEFQWSDILTPLFWLSLPVLRETRLQPLMREFEVAIEHVEAVATYWERSGVRDAPSLVTWLRGFYPGVDREAVRRGRDPVVDRQAVAPFQYFQDYLQKRAFAEIPGHPAVQAAFCGAL
eukprot:8660900-Alexandrium_andersonii.AAC.1